MPTGLKRFYGKGHLHFITFSCYRRLPLLKTARARDVFRERVGQGARRDGASVARLCGDAGTRPFAVERAAARNALDCITQVEVTRGAEDAEAKKTGLRGTTSIAI